MVLQGRIQPNHFPINSFQLSFIGNPLGFIFTEVTGLDTVFDTVKMPDRTVVSGGNTQPVEFTAKLPLHHQTEYTAMLEWCAEVEGGVFPTYKRNGLLTINQLSGAGAIPGARWGLLGLFPKKHKTPDLNMADDGKMGEVDFQFSVDIVVLDPLTIF